jgi:hypothetical protein
MHPIRRGHRNPAWSKRLDGRRQGSVLDPLHEAGEGGWSDPTSRPRCGNKAGSDRDCRAKGRSIASLNCPGPSRSGPLRHRSRRRARACSRALRPPHISVLSFSWSHPLAGSRSMPWRTHHAVAEALHLELANVASSFALALLPADQLLTRLLQRRAVVSCFGPLRGLRWSRQRDERKHQYDRPRGTKRLHGTSPYIKEA